MKIYIGRNGQQQGPYSIEELNKLALSEPITGNDMCWHEGCADWIPLSQFPGFIASLPPSPTSVPQASAITQVSANNTLYYLLLNNEQAGPYTAEQLRSMWQNGVANAQTQYCFAGGASWQPLINLRTMLESSPDQPTPVSSAPQRVPVAGLTPQSPPTKTLSAVIKYGGGIIALVIAAGICFQFFGKTTISSIEDVQKYIVGTWTDTSGKEFWNKLIFKRDGSVEEYLARPGEDNWGKAMMKTWKPITAKYSDTGLRYYGIEVTGFGKHLVLTDDGHLRFSIGPDLRMEFTKGDKFPFSK